MNLSKLIITMFCMICTTLSVQVEFLDYYNRGSTLRQKKKVMKKPCRVRGRQASNFQHSTIASADKYLFSVTSENPSDAWKPITYSTSFSENEAHSEGRETIELHAASNGKIGYINHSKPADSQTRSSHNEPNINNYQDYSLLHYYMPFHNIMLTDTKPITEPLREKPKKPISVEQIMKAGIEPVASFATTSTPTTTEEPVTVLESNDNSGIESNDSKFSGKYEYEYHIQDNHWGTNFGHKEYREGEYTKGDYEVVLPDNRIQHVRYWSDASGYHAQVTYHPLYKKFKHFKSLIGHR